MARDKLQSSAICDLKLKLISDRQSNGKLYNLPNYFEVSVLIVGDEHTNNKRDIIIEKKTGRPNAFYLLLSTFTYLHLLFLP